MTPTSETVKRKESTATRGVQVVTGKEQFKILVTNFKAEEKIILNNELGFMAEGQCLFMLAAMNTAGQIFYVSETHGNIIEEHQGNPKRVQNIFLSEAD